MLVVFDTLNVYYLPQYTPIIQQLQRNNHQVKLVCYSSKNDQDALKDVLANINAECPILTTSNSLFFYEF